MSFHHCSTLIFIYVLQGQRTEPGNFKKSNIVSDIGDHWTVKYFDVVLERLIVSGLSMCVWHCFILLAEAAVSGSHRPVRIHPILVTHHLLLFTLRITCDSDRPLCSVTCTAFYLITAGQNNGPFNLKFIEAWVAIWVDTPLNSLTFSFPHWRNSINELCFARSNFILKMLTAKVNPYHVTVGICFSMVAVLPTYL